MRTRKEIEKISANQSDKSYGDGEIDTQIEILLDIRELLENLTKPIVKGKIKDIKRCSKCGTIKHIKDDGICQRCYDEEKSVWGGLF